MGVSASPTFTKEQHGKEGSDEIVVVEAPMLEKEKANVEYIVRNFGYPEEDVKEWMSTVGYPVDVAVVPLQVVVQTLELMYWNRLVWSTDLNRDSNQPHLQWAISVASKLLDIAGREKEERCTGKDMTPACLIEICHKDPSRSSIPALRRLECHHEAYQHNTRGCTHSLATRHRIITHTRALYIEMYTPFHPLLITLFWTKQMHLRVYKNSCGERVWFGSKLLDWEEA
ncbi:1808_t:CDS:2 [Acaulospora colombiana]|uniref:1808_t:CDS:1 n=1 Tax=Acaulospora colombiana TaxID=27376 RepID=A0ACA9MJZ4_9GLOM|nr:1808_t:CDS:2 [Acaulospora colombiana]